MQLEEDWHNDCFTFYMIREGNKFSYLLIYIQIKIVELKAAALLNAVLLTEQVFSEKT